MRLLPKRHAGASLRLSPEHPLRPTETVTALVTLDEALDGVTSASVQLGYVNTYRYQWAGRRDAALRHDDTSFLTLGQVGTSYGSDRDTTDWVAVLAEPLAVSHGRLAAGPHTAALRLPSWSPGSSASIVAWEARLRIEHGGHVTKVAAPLQALSAAPSSPPTDLPVLQGDGLSDTCAFDIVTERTVYRPGELVRGIVSVTPRTMPSREAELDLRFTRCKTSHPLTRTPGAATELDTRPAATVASGLRLVQSVTADMPFALNLPADVDPTTDAVHSSLAWYVKATLTFAGMTGAIERARREIVVFTA